MNTNIERVNSMWVSHLPEWSGNPHSGWTGNASGTVQPVSGTSCSHGGIYSTRNKDK